jgi:carboxylate-amine ligase
VATPEVLEENRFLATRDGMRAELLDPAAGTRRPARELLEELLAQCEPHAVALRCDAELRGAGDLASLPGVDRQRAAAGLRPGQRDGQPHLRDVLAELSAAFNDAVRPVAR